MELEWYWVMTGLIGSVVFFMLLGMPVVFAFFTVNIAGAFIFMGGEKGMMQLVRSAEESVQSFALLPIPLFILMGEIMFYTGVASRAIDAIDKLIARVPGRLSLVAITGGTIFSSLSGSTTTCTMPERSLRSTKTRPPTRRTFAISVATIQGMAKCSKQAEEKTTSNLSPCPK